MFYHRSSHNGIFSRRVCAEPIFFLPDGTIREAEQTSGGAGGPLNAYSPIPAGAACHMTGSCHIRLDAQEGAILSGCGGGAEAAKTGWLKWAEYRELDFGKGPSFGKITLRGTGTLFFRTTQNRLLGHCTVDSSQFITLSFPTDSSIQGTLPLWILFDGEGIEVKEMRFFME